jgi:hypothetical protein
MRDSKGTEGRSRFLWDTRNPVRPVLFAQVA